MLPPRKTESEGNMDMPSSCVMYELDTNNACSGAL